MSESVSQTVGSSASPKHSGPAHEEIHQDSYGALGFLWAKWSHHDQLIYTRFNLFWQLHAAFFAAVAALALPSVELTRVSMIVLSLLAIIVSIAGRALLKACETDRSVRNGFNREIVTAMETAGLLKAGLLSRDDWAPDIWDHPINRWHERADNATRRLRKSYVPSSAPNVHRLALFADVLIAIVLLGVYVFFFSR
jgi:hypothetical protein